MIKYEWQRFQCFYLEHIWVFSLLSSKIILKTPNFLPGRLFYPAFWQQKDFQFRQWIIDVPSTIALRSSPLDTIFELFLENGYSPSTIFSFQKILLSVESIFNDHIRFNFLNIRSSMTVDAETRRWRLGKLWRRSIFHILPIVETSATIVDLQH